MMRCQTLCCHSLSRRVKTPSWLSFEILQPGTIFTSPTSGRNQEKEYSRAWRGRDQWNSKLKLFSTNGSLSGSVLCLKLPQTMTSNNHREAGPAREKRIENVTNGFSRWLFKMTGTDWRHSWCLRVTEAAIKNIRGILSNYQEAGAWHRKNRGILEAVEKSERMKPSAGQWNYNYCKTSLVCKINYLTHDFYQNNKSFQHSVWLFSKQFLLENSLS